MTAWGDSGFLGPEESEKLANDLWIAVAHSGIDEIKLLLFKGTNPNHDIFWKLEWIYEDMDIWKLPPLHTACDLGKLQAAKALIESGANVDRGDAIFDMCPLHFALQKSHKNIVKYLTLDNQCNLYLRDKFQQTVLHHACRGGNKENILLLVEILKFNIGKFLRDKDGHSPLDLLDQKSQDYLDVGLCLTRNDVCDKEDRAKLFCECCFRGKLDSVKELMEHIGDHPEAILDQNGRTPLQIALMSDRTYLTKGCIDVAVYLAINYHCGSQEDIANLLRRVCQTDQIDTVDQLILEHNFKLNNIRDDSYLTPLHHACFWGKLCMVKHLVEVFNCDVNASSKNGTPLEIALDDVNDPDHFSVANYLIRHGSGSIRHKTKLFFAACRKGEVDVMKELIHKHNIDPKGIRDESNKTPLHHACLTGQSMVTQYLIEEFHCDIGLRDDEDRTPLAYAMENNHSAIVNYLNYSQHSSLESQGAKLLSTSNEHLNVDLTSSHQEHEKDAGQLLPSTSKEHLNVDLTSSHQEPEKGTPLTNEELDALRMVLLRAKIRLPLHQLNTFESIQSSLLANGHDDIVIHLKNTLQSVIKEQRQYLKILEHLIADKNTIDVRYLKVFLVGPPGVGKTTTLNRLLKIIDNISSDEAKAQCNSTLLVNFTQVLAFAAVSDSEDSPVWLPALESENEETNFVFSLLHSNVFSSNTPKSCIKGPNKEKKTTKVVTFSSEPEHPPSKISAPTSPVIAPQIEDYQKSKLIAIKSRLQSAIKSGDYSRLTSLSNSTLLNINDVGGQPGFLEMLPALSCGPAIYLVFFDLSKDLNTPYSIPFSRGDTNITPYKDIHTSKATISQILSAITSVHCVSRKSHIYQSISKIENKFEVFKKISPLASIIGTHRDRLDDPEKMLAEIDHDLENIMESFRDHKVLTFPPKSDSPAPKFFLSVDNYTGSEKTDIGLIRSFLNQVFNTQFKETSVPIRPVWLIFNTVLRQEYKIVTMEDCLEIGRIFNMEEDEIKFCLLYLDYIGTIMYYPDIVEDEDNWFQNHIICSPQVIFDSISQLVIASLRQMQLVKERIELDQRGQFSLETIEKYCYSKEVTEKLLKKELIPIKRLLRLLEHFNLLSPIFNPEMQQTTYLMPSVLECAPLSELPFPDSDNPIKPLYITFKCGFVPTGSFCGLISWLVSNGPNKILGLQWKIEEEGVKRNLVCFIVDDVYKVLLLCHERCFEIRVISMELQTCFHNICTHILSVIIITLSMLFENIGLEIGFRCLCKKHKPNQVGLFKIKEGSKVRFLCENSRKCAAFKKEHQVWFGKEIHLGESTSILLPEFSKTYPFLNLNFEWSKVEGDMGAVGNKLVCTNKPNVLTIDSVHENDIGYYKCVVKEDRKLIFIFYKAIYKRTDAPLVQQPRKEKQKECVPQRASLKALSRGELIGGSSISYPDPTPSALRHGERIYSEDDEKLSNIIQRFGVVEEHLDTECSDDDLEHFGRQLVGYSKYANALGLSRADIAEIDGDTRINNSTKEKFTAVLKKWKSKGKLKSSPATYRSLLKVAIKLEDGDNAQEICAQIKRIIKDNSTSSGHTMEYQDKASEDEAFTNKALMELIRVYSIKDDQLDIEIEEKDVVSLAEYFDSFEKYALIFELRKAEISDLKILAFIQGSAVAMANCLFDWRKRMASNATLRALLAILLNFKEVDTASRVCSHYFPKSKHPIARHVHH